MTNTDKTGARVRVLFQVQHDNAPDPVMSTIRATDQLFAKFRFLGTLSTGRKDSSRYLSRVFLPQPDIENPRNNKNFLEPGD